MKATELNMYKGVDEIPSNVWQQLPTPTIYFSKGFLKAFEQGNPRLEPLYYVIKDGDQILALAVLQLLSVSLAETGDGLSSGAYLARSIQQFINKGNTRILICGNLFLSGPYGVHTRDSSQITRCYAQVLETIQATQNQHRAHIYFLKDYPYDDQVAPEIFIEERFQPFEVEPNMILTLENSWKTFDDYKQALRSKYRNKVKKADKTSAVLQVNRLTAADIRKHRDTLQELLAQVTAKAAFNAMNLRIETYALLQEEFGESQKKNDAHFIMHGYWMEDKIIGFATALVYDQKLDAHFVGLDYRYNRTYAIYPRMLNDYVRMGLEYRVKTVNFGRTASEIKSTLGATPQHIRCYLRHRRTLANLFFKPLLGYIQRESYHQHEAFKEKGT
ncbi:hypothetical protein [Croceiramulus getboli]|nr:GNAT family N-acetyltransferase [Flavobacteriaceae bacterium YJPT1-3]